MLWKTTTSLSALVLVTFASLVQAQYRIETPTAATRWVSGQAGLIRIVSTDKAKANTSPTDRLLTITLQAAKDSVFGGSNQVAAIQDRVQLLIPAASTQASVSLEISNWVVPANVPPGTNYFVHLERARDGFFDIPDKADSATFQIVASDPTGPPVPGGNTTLTPSATASSVAPPTPTLPAGQTCDDIRQQCAVQKKQFVDTTPTAICSCGVDLIQPEVRASATTVRAGGATSALAVLVLVAMTML